MKSYILNLYNAYSRRLSSLSELNREGLKYELVYAFNNNQFCLQSYANHLSAGAVGAFISHYQVLLNASQVADDVILIFEDDIALAAGFKNNLQQKMALLPDDWDIAFIGWFLQNGGGVQPGMGNEHWCRVHGGLGQYGYLVKRTSIPKILGGLYHITDHVDKQLSRAVERGKLNGYWLKTPLVTCKEFESQIPK